MQRSILAAVMAVALAPATAFAGPKFEELERAVAPDVTDVEAINTALVAALGGDTGAIKAVQRECFGAKGVANGVIGEKTALCLHNHAEVMARARKHAADDRAAIEKELGTCTAGAGDCAKARAAAETAAKAAAAERDALAAKLKTGGGSCDPDVKPLAAAEAYANAHCAAGSQICWQAPDKFSCTEPLFQIVQGACALDASGTQMTCDASVNSAPGRGGVVPIPAPPPVPESKGTCDGVGGALLCYVAPAALVVIGGLLVADAVSDDFNLVTVRR